MGRLGAGLPHQLHRAADWARWFAADRTGSPGACGPQPGVPPRNRAGPPPSEPDQPNEPNGRDRLNGLDEPDEPGGLHGRSRHRPRRPSASAGRSAVDRGRSRSWSSWAPRVRRHRRVLAHRSPSSTPRSVSACRADRRARPGADVRGHDGAGAHPRVSQRGHPCWHPQPRGRARGQRTGRRRRPDRPRRPGGVSGVTRRRRREASACSRLCRSDGLDELECGVGGIPQGGELFERPEPGCEPERSGLRIALIDSGRTQLVTCRNSTPSAARRRSTRRSMSRPMPCRWYAGLTAIR